MPIVVYGPLLHTAPAKGGDITFKVGRGLSQPDAAVYFSVGNDRDTPIEVMRFTSSGEIYVWNSRMTTDLDLTSTFLDWASTVLGVHPIGPLRVQSGNGYLGGPPGDIIFRLADDREVLKLQVGSAVVLGEPTKDPWEVVGAVRRFLVGVLSQVLRDPKLGFEGDMIIFPEDLRLSVWDRLNEDNDADYRPNTNP
jgi:hypothetical protein